MLSVTVRLAAESDLPTLVDFGRQFYEKTMFHGMVSYCPEGAESFFRSMMANDLLFVAVDGEKVVGTIGLIIGPFLINHTHGMASELFWWIDPAHRRSGAGLALMDAAESAAREQGATFLTMVALEGGEVEQAAKIYRARGYTPAEHTWTKRL